VRFDDLHLRDGTPIYAQIIQHLKAGIAAGTVQDGDELPSRRTLSALLLIHGVYCMGIYLLFWLFQVSLVMATAALFRFLSTPDTFSVQLELLTSYRSIYLHPLFPLADWLFWIITPLIYLGLGANTAIGMVRSWDGKVYSGVCGVHRPVRRQTRRLWLRCLPDVRPVGRGMRQLLPVRHLQGSGGGSMKMQALLPMTVSSGKALQGLGLGALAAVCCNLYYLYSYAQAYQDLWYRGADGMHYFRSDAIMPPFFSLLGFSLYGCVIAVLAMIPLAWMFWRSHFTGSKSIYLMRRLSNPRELPRRCLTVPILAAVFYLILALLLFWN